MCFIFGIQGLVKAENYLYNVVVSVSVEYYYEDGISYVGHHSGITQTITIPVCASSPEEARDKAEYECGRMCSTDRAQRMGSEMFNGKMLPKFMVRKIYDAKPINTERKC